MSFIWKSNLENVAPSKMLRLGVATLQQGEARRVTRSLLSCLTSALWPPRERPAYPFPPGSLYLSSKWYCWIHHENPLCLLSSLVPPQWRTVTADGHGSIQGHQAPGWHAAGGSCMRVGGWGASMSGVPLNCTLTEPGARGSGRLADQSTPHRRPLVFTSPAPHHGVTDASNGACWGPGPGPQAFEASA